MNMLQKTATGVALTTLLALGTAGCPSGTGILANLISAGTTTGGSTGSSGSSGSAGTTGTTASNTNSDTDADSTDADSTPTVSVSIIGPDEIMVGNTAVWLASGAGAANLSFTWDLLGTAATLNSTSGSSTSVSGASIGTVTLVVEARASTFGNVLATNTHTISIEPGVEYVVWYDSADDCWSAPQLHVGTRTSFDSATAEGQKAVLQGGFSTTQQARDWICSAIQSKKIHAWCGVHYNIDGSYYLYSGGCDLSAIPTEG